MLSRRCWRPFVSGALFVLLLSALPALAQDGRPDMLSDILKEAKQKFAPDRRTTVFDIQPDPHGKVVVLRGEIHSIAMKKELFAFLAEHKDFTFEDSIQTLPQPVLGDLYFELHETKREVYVVTHIDSQAWPDGTGYVRSGFDPRRIAQYRDHEEFRAAYLESVLAYERLRRELDGLIGQGVTPDAAQQAQEIELRTLMDSFTQRHALRVGDVFQVPPLLPHSLQHGVRVVEFQTPSYERKILSFAQKVTTQDHWDSREAVARMLLRAPPVGAQRELDSAPGITIEQIVDFPEFEVQRLTIRAQIKWQLECGPSYALLLVVTGVLELAGSRYGSEQAVLLPRNWSGAVLAPQAPAPLVLLLAKPHG